LLPAALLAVAWVWSFGRRQELVTVPPYRGLLWHDADPRKRFTRSYRVAVCETVAEFLKEDAARMRQAGSPNDK